MELESYEIIIQIYYSEALDAEIWRWNLFETCFESFSLIFASSVFKQPFTKVIQFQVQIQLSATRSEFKLQLENVASVLKA